MIKFDRSVCKAMLVVPAMLMPMFVCQYARAQSLSVYAQIGVANLSNSPVDYSLDQHFNSTGAPESASTSTSFSGVNSQSVNKTMTYAGSVLASAEFGRLHSFVDCSVTNPYYSASNPIYYDANNPNDPIDPAGSPDILEAAGFTGFTDTLQFGGSLSGGYKARYIFHLDGVNSGTNTGAYLGVTIANDLVENFSNTNSGNISMNWATMGHDVNGVTPQTISVNFSAQFNAYLLAMPEGADFAGTANFSSTLTLAAIELVDANTGNLASGWTVTSASGTQYNTIQGSVVPEPGSMALLAGLTTIGAGLVRKRRNRSN